MRIVLDDLHDRQQVASLLEFLASRSPTRPVQRGTTIEIENGNVREAKLLLHKFLHHAGLDDYRVLSHTGVLEIVRLEKGKRRRERPEGLKPSMPGPIAGIPHPVKPSDMVEWSSHPWEKKSSSKTKNKD